MLQSVILRLEAPLQSWGTQGRFGIRDTDTEPSKSGVLGLIGAAMGMPRDDRATLARLARLEMATRVDREGTVMRDYHTVGGGRFRGQEYGVWTPNDSGTGGKPGKTAPTVRMYLADASFLVALAGDDELVARIADALVAPVWPLFLGRKACPPARPVLAGMEAGPPPQVLAVQPYPGRLAGKEGKPRSERLRLLVERGSGSPRHDVPVSFERYGRVHARRYIEAEWIPTPPVVEDAP